MVLRRRQIPQARGVPVLPVLERDTFSERICGDMIGSGQLLRADCTDNDSFREAVVFVNLRNMNLPLCQPSAGRETGPRQ